MDYYPTSLACVAGTSNRSATTSNPVISESSFKQTEVRFFVLGNGLIPASQPDYFRGPFLCFLDLVSTFTYSRERPIKSSMALVLQSAFVGNRADWIIRASRRPRMDALRATKIQRSVGESLQRKTRRRVHRKYAPKTFVRVCDSNDAPIPCSEGVLDFDRKWGTGPSRKLPGELLSPVRENRVLRKP
jgi:hypothetical protein